MTAPELARFAADLDTAHETSRELTAQRTQLVAAHQAARAAGRETVHGPDRTVTPRHGGAS